MQTAPAGYETEWEEAVRDLKPFATLVYVSKDDSARADTYDLADFIALSCVKTLYANWSFGNAASSQLDGQSHVYKAEIGDRLRVSLRPASSASGAQVWYGHFIVNSTDLDPYTGICSFTAVDVLTYYGDTMFEDTAGEFDVLSFSYYATKCAALMGITLNSDYPPYTGTEQAYNFDGFTCRDVLTRIAALTGQNATVTNNGTLGFMNMGGSLYNITPFLLSVGRRAERISVNGFYHELRYSIKNEIKRETRSGDPIVYIPPAPFAYYAGTLGGGPGIAQVTTDGLSQVDHTGAYQYTAYPFFKINDTLSVAYSAFAAENVVITPLVELGDTVIALGKASTSLITDEFMQPLLYDDGTRLNAENPREYTPYWDAQVSTQEIYGIVGKITVDFRTPQIATIESLPPVS